MRGFTTDRAPLLSATTSHSKSTTTVTGGGVCPSFSCCFSPFILFYLPFFVQRSSQENRCSKICIRLASKASFSSSFLTLKSCKLACCCCCCCCCCFFPQGSLCFTLAADVAGRQHFCVPWIVFCQRLFNSTLFIQNSIWHKWTQTAKEALLGVALLSSPGPSSPSFITISSFSKQQNIWLRLCCLLTRIDTKFDVVCPSEHPYCSYPGNITIRRLIICCTMPSLATHTLWHSSMRPCFFFWQQQSENLIFHLH